MRSGLRFDDDFFLPHFVAHNGTVNADRTALVSGDIRLTWAEVDEATNRIANALLDLPARKGDRVAVLMRNSVESFLLFWGVLKSGCVLVPLNTMLDGPSLARMLHDIQPAALFVQPEFRWDRSEHPDRCPPETHCFTTGPAVNGWSSMDELLERASGATPDVRISGDDIATVIYTSGTTGTPKGITHTHRARVMYPLGFGHGLRVDRHSVAVCTTPIYATGTWTTMMPAVYCGGTVVLTPDASPEALLEAIERERGTHVFLVPTQTLGLLACADLKTRDTSSWRVLCTAGQTLSPSIYQAFRDALPTTDIYEVYGMSEGFATLAGPGDIAAGKQGTVGKPLFMEDIRIIDEDLREVGPGVDGEIVAHGYGMLSGYYGNPELTAEATWVSPSGRTYVRSGDIGCLDEDGYLYIRGRIKDMIKSGGINVYARDIEDVFIAHPEVREVAAIPIPHEKWLETPLLIAVLQEGASVTEDELREWGNAKLAKYQRVTRVEFRDDLPRATYGKVRKSELRAEYWKTEV